MLSVNGNAFVREAMQESEAGLVGFRYNLNDYRIVVHAKSRRSLDFIFFFLIVKV